MFNFYLYNDLFLAIGCMIMQHVCEKPLVGLEKISVQSMLRTPTLCNLGFFAEKSTIEFKENMPVFNTIVNGGELCLKRSLDITRDPVDSKRRKLGLESSMSKASRAPLACRLPEYDSEYDQFVDIELAEINAQFAGVSLYDTRKGIDTERLFKSKIGSIEDAGMTSNSSLMLNGSVQ